MNETMDYPHALVDDQSIGHWLRGLREAKEMSIADVASHLRLDESRIEALESDSCQEGMQAYARGYIRQYAKLMDADGEAIDAKIASMRPEERVFVSPFKSSALKGDKFKGLLTQHRLSLLVLSGSLLIIWIIAQAWASGSDEQEAAQRIEAMVNVNVTQTPKIEHANQPDLSLDASTETSLQQKRNLAVVDTKHHTKD